MLKIGITGSIGAGKSTAGKWVTAQGYSVLDADKEIARLYKESDELRYLLADAFGKSILTPQGVQKEFLANLIFKNESARIKLESIVYPFLKDSIHSFWTNHLQNDYLVFVEAALFFKIPEILNQLDLVWQIEAPLALRLSRLIQRGLTADDAQQRITLQNSNPPLKHLSILKIYNDTSETIFYSRLKEALHSSINSSPQSRTVKSR